MFGPEDVISTYTRAQAIEDGVLVDVSEVAREAGFKFPVALTRAAWEDFVTWDAADSKRKGGWPQDENGRLWDVIWMASLAARSRRDESIKLYQFLRVPREGRGTSPRKVIAKMMCGPGDSAEPVITILLPHED